MNEPQLPPQLRRAFDEIARSTAELLTALREADAVEIERCVQRRADAVERLEEPLRDFNEAASASLLAEEKAKLDRAAQGAIDELRLTAGRIRASLKSGDRDAIRSYSERSATAIGLDRSG